MSSRPRPVSLSKRNIVSVSAKNEDADSESTPVEPLTQPVSTASGMSISTLTSPSTTSEILLSPVTSATKELPGVPPELLLLLKTLPFFSNEALQTDEFLNDISKVMHIRKFAPGDAVVHSGETAKAMFFVIRGLLRVVSDDVGEIGILFDVRRTATVVTKTACMLVALRSEDVKATLEKYPQIKNHLKSLGEKRFHELAQELKKAGREVRNDLSERFYSKDGTESVGLGEIKARMSSRRSSFMVQSPEIVSVINVPDDVSEEDGEAEDVGFLGVSNSGSLGVRTPSGRTSEALSPTDALLQAQAPMSAAAMLAKKANEKRKASIAVWSDDKLMQLAQNAGSSVASRRNNGAPRVFADAIAAIVPSDSIDSLRPHADTIHQYGFIGLGEEIIARICTFSSLKDVMRIRRFSKFCKQIVEDPIFDILHNNDMRHFNKTMNNERLDFLLSVTGKQLRILNLKNCWHLNDMAMKNLGEYTSNLRELNLGSVWDVTDVGLCQLAPNCPMLQSIDLSNCRKITNASVLSFLQHCPDLIAIELSYCKNLSDDILSHPRWGTMERANFQRCTGIFDDGFDHWAGKSKASRDRSTSLIADKTPVVMISNPEESHKLAKKMPTSFKMKELILSDCSFLTDVTISTIAETCFHLTRLSLSFCCSLTEGFALVLVAGCTGIQELDVSYCGNAVTDASITDLSKGLQELHRLSLRGCIQCTENSIEILNTHATSLKELNVTQCKNITPQVIQTHGNPRWKFLTSQNFFEPEPGSPKPVKQQRIRSQTLAAPHSRNMTS